MYSHKNFKFWNASKLWKLRNDIVLNSIYYSDYYNRFGINERVVCRFFDGYMEYLEEITKEELNTDFCKIEELFERDNKKNLWAWFNCFEECPFDY